MGRWVEGWARSGARIASLVRTVVSFVAASAAAFWRGWPNRWPSTTRNLYENVFWPAAAGNVAWAFCTLWIKDQQATGWRLAILLVFALYLAAGWLQLKAAEDGEIRNWFWPFEALHLFFLCMASISAVERLGEASDLPWWLTGYFLVTIAGHAMGAWRFSANGMGVSWALVVANACGVAVLHGAAGTLGAEPSMTASFGVALGLWWLARRRDIKEIERRLKEREMRRASPA